MKIIEPKIYMITATIDSEYRPNVEILFYDEDINEVKRVYNELTKEIPDINTLEMMGVNTEYFERFEDIKIRIMYEVSENES
jgi:hypothetical protein